MNLFKVIQNPSAYNDWIDIGYDAYKQILEFTDDDFLDPPTTHDPRNHISTLVNLAEGANDEELDNIWFNIKQHRVHMRDFHSGALPLVKASNEECKILRKFSSSSEDKTKLEKDWFAIMINQNFLGPLNFLYPEKCQSLEEIFPMIINSESVSSGTGDEESKTDDENKLNVLQKLKTGPKRSQNYQRNRNRLIKQDKRYIEKFKGTGAKQLVRTTDEVFYNMLKYTHELGYSWETVVELLKSRDKLKQKQAKRVSPTRSKQMKSEGSKAKTEEKVKIMGLEKKVNIKQEPKGGVVEEVRKPHLGQLESSEISEHSFKDETEVKNKPDIKILDDSDSLMYMGK
jgi:hypothetical protein